MFYVFFGISRVLLSNVQMTLLWVPIKVTLRWAWNPVFLTNSQRSMELSYYSICIILNTYIFPQWFSQPWCNKSTSYFWRYNCFYIELAKKFIRGFPLDSMGNPEWTFLPTQYTGKEKNHGVSQVALVVKKLSANAGDIRDGGSIPGSGRSPGGEHGNPLQCSCLENPMDRGAWWVQSIASQRIGQDWSDLAE